MKLSFFASENLFFFFKNLCLLLQNSLLIWTLSWSPKNLFALSKHTGWLKLLLNGEENVLKIYWLLEAFEDWKNWRDIKNSVCGCV